MSKIGQLCDLICGQHCMGGDPLTDYHHAKRARNALRSRDRLPKVKHALKAYPVMVSEDGDGRIRIHNHRTGKTLVF